MRSAGDSDSNRNFDEAVAQFRIALTAGRSTVFLRLFDFLVERSHDDRSPKEVEIALAVFGEDGGRGNATDSSVRVYVHRLRKRLDEFYVHKSGPRLMIPKGEYRVVLNDAPDMKGRRPRVPWWPKWRWRPAMTGFAILAAIGAASFALYVSWPQQQTDPQTNALRKSGFWQSVNSDSSPLIVIGDNFLIAETTDQKQVQRMILDPDIRSREDLGLHLKTHPEDFYRLYDLDLNFTPSGTAIASWTLQNIVADLGAAPAGGPRLMSSSRLDSNTLATNMIVYVGRLSNLGAIAAPLFQASRLRPGSSYNELMDEPTGRPLVANPAGGGDGPHIDYGYIARFHGSSGNLILVVAGIGDTAVASMTTLVSNPAQLGAVDAKIGEARNFEAVFEVGAVDEVVMSRRLILARALD